MKLFSSWSIAARDRFQLRAYRESDLEAMFLLDQVCFEETFRFDRWTMYRFAEARNALSMVAEREDGTLAGFAIVHLQMDRGSRYGYVITLDVAPEARRNGLAGDLLSSLEARARKEGAVRMELHVWAENTGAIRFYERSGYLLVGRQVDFYGAGRDGLGYWKPLS